MAEKAKARPSEVTVDGITVRVSLDPTDDYELAMCSMVIYGNDSDPSDVSRAVARRNMLVLGDDYQAALDALRSANGGSLRIATVNDFVSRVIREVEKAKN